MRADAARNREAILRAAGRLLVEQGIDVSLEAIACEADVAVATLYRRFPDRESLLTGVALLSLRECGAVAEASLRALDHALNGPDAEQVWQAFVRSFTREWVGVYLLTLLRSTSALATEELTAARHATLLAFEQLVTGAQDRALIRSDATSFEVWSLLLAVVRPMPGVPAADQTPLVRRHLQLVLAGLRPAAGAPLTGRAVTQQVAELQAAGLASRQVSAPRRTRSA